MDVESLAKQLILKGMTEEQQKAILDSIKTTMTQARTLQKQRVGENVQVVVQALKKLEADIRERYDEVGNKIEKRVATIKDGKDGLNGSNGKDGKDGRPGRDGGQGPRGADGLNGNDGRDGTDGVSVTDAHIDFDGSLIISLSSGRTINVGEVVAPDLAEKIKVITNGGGTSQVVLDTLASLQTQINNLIPSQTGNAGKFLTTNGSALSWANVAGGLSYQGTWNASTNTPTLASGTGTNGYYYITATAGSTNLDGITDWQIGDWLMFNGTVWQKIDQSNLVTSVNGQTGAVSLTTTNISEGTNQYFTDARARAAISAGTGISYSSSTGVVTNAAPDQTVALTAGTGISTSGTYPNFTIANTAPDQTVVLTGSGTTTVTGTYPNFTIASADSTTGTVTSVGGTGTVNGISLSGTVTSSGNLTLGGTLSGVDLTTQVTGALPIANGGTGQTTRQEAMDALAGAVTAGQYLRGNGTDVVMSTIQAADVPTLNQNTTGTASNVTGTVAVANGGTGSTSLTANNVLLGNGTSAVQAVAPGTSGNVLTSNGTTWTSAAAAGGGFPSGTLMLFAQTTAPTGWTKSTTHDNKALRVVSGTASSGGSTGFTSVFTNQTVSTSISVSISGTTGATTLSTSQMPSHTHSAYAGNTLYGTTGGGFGATNSQTGATGGGGSHTHSFSGSGSGSGTSSAVTLNVAYVDVIIASKN
jgi:hypothetical protein